MKITILDALKNEAEKLQKQLGTIQSAISVLGGGNSSGNGRKHRNGRRRKFSTAARKRMSLAAQARWGKIKAKAAK